MAASAIDRFEARVETNAEADKLLNTGPARIKSSVNSINARAIKRTVAENPELHQQYLREFNERAQANRFRR